MNGTANIFADIPDLIQEELFTPILHSAGCRIERIVSRGHRSPEGFWYDQDEDEWVVLLKGSAALRFKDRDEFVTLKPGDHILIEKNRRHRVEWTDPGGETVWLAVYYR
ncbi:MAG: cupin domain-containing protein [Syntrophaceae bacterium]|nr:cupin domain-containing protein [Syntrophaceae bacterium]